MNIFYVPDIRGNVVQLDEKESKHGIRVMRLSQGSSVFLVDGKGGFYEGEVLEPNPKRCVIQVHKVQKEYGQRNYRLHLALAPTKNIDRFEWFLEKAVEFGVDEITPVLCFHSERKKIKPERLERIIISAMKQSLKAYKPTLNPLTEFPEFLGSISAGTACYIAHCRQGQRYSLMQQLRPGGTVCIAIGPEGDFSDQEVEQAIQGGFMPVSLGTARLRTETAGVAACHTTYLINQNSP